MAADNDAHLRELIPHEVLHMLFRQFCLDRFNYTDGHVNEQARQEHIDCDARSYYEDPDAPVLKLAQAAFAAGRESMLDRDEWRVCSGPANKQLPEEFQFPYIFAEEIESEAEALDELTRARDQWRSEDSWLEHRRNGSTAWVRVPEEETDRG